MFIIILLILDSVVAAYFAKSYVKRNRGLMLDMPDWSLIPDMTVILFQFIFSGFLLFAFYLRTKNEEQTYECILFFVCFCCLSYLAFRVKAVRELIGSKITEKISQNIEKLRRASNKKDNENVENKRIHKKRFNDAVAYAEYTLLYTIRYSLVFFLVETIVYYLLSEVFLPATASSDMNLLYIIQNDLKMIHVLLVVLILEIAGVCLTMVRIFAVVQYVEKKPVRKPLDKIRDYLRSEEVKN